MAHRFRGRLQTSLTCLRRNELCMIRAGYRAIGCQVRSRSMRLRLVLIFFAGLRLLAGPIAVTLSGNFGAPQGGSSIFDNQSYVVSFLIADPASPSQTTCCLGQMSATYDVTANLSVPGIGLSLNDPVQVQYNSQLPLGKWLNILGFTGLPVGDQLLLTPFQINSGDLWNGLAGSAGTPVITLLNNQPGTGTWHLEQNSSMGPLPIAVYSNGPMSISATEVPEPIMARLLAPVILGLAALRVRASRRRQSA